MAARPVGCTPTTSSGCTARRSSSGGDWLSGATYRGRWREMVVRSALTLKLMTYAPTGGIVAAPTAALPEQVGGERNWDYRYTWIRDGSFSIYALLGLGFTEEAAAFGDWLRDRAAEQAGGDSGPLKIMYRVDGSSDLTEGQPRPLRGLARLPPGAGRQRRRRPASARHLRRDDGRDAPRRPARRPDRPPELAGDRQPDRLAVRALGPARRGDLGDPRRTQGLRLRPYPELGRARPGDQDGDQPGPPGRPDRAGGRSGTRSTTRSSRRAGTRGSAASPSSTAARCSTRRC